MKVVSTIVLVLLILLGAASGVPKVMLMEQEVNFFGQYGFANWMLIAFGLTQIAGAVLMVFTRTRFIGAAIVAITFLISLAVLILEGNVPVSIITAVATMSLGAIMVQSRPSPAED
jgi:hypothetical protein